MSSHKIQFFVIDANLQCICYGKCKLMINKIVNQLIITPLQKEVEEMHLNFDRIFVYRENTLGILNSDVDPKNYILFLPNSDNCKLIFDATQKEKTINALENDEIETKFCELVQLVNRDNSYPSDQNAIQDFTSRKQLLRNNSNPTDEENHNHTATSLQPRKRRRAPSRSKACTKIIKSPNFKIIKNELGEKSNTKLIVFPDNDKTQCYEYSWNNSTKVYNCLGCKIFTRGISAKIYRNASGNNYVKLLSTKHVCKLRSYNPDKFDSSKRIVTWTNFKIIENELDEKTAKKLIIFPLADDKIRCFEYIWNASGNLYNCIGCRKLKKRISAKICKNVNGEDYVKLLSTEHVCKLRTYNPEKFYFDPSKLIYDSSNYQVFNYNQKGKYKSTMVLFCPTNKTLCYEYFWNNHAQNYTCVGCNMEKRVTAVICKNNDGTEYVKLSKEEHICDLREVNLLKFKNDLMIQKPLYKVIERVDHGIKKKFLLIFTGNEREYCYKFAYYNSERCFYCLKCGYHRINIRAFVINNQEDEECVFVRDRKHICAPIEYALLMKDNIVRPPNFQLLKRKVDGRIIQHLVIFSNIEKSECYEYTWLEKNKKFICYRCRHHKTYVYAKLHKTEENGEFVELRKTEHKCTPIQYIPEKSVKKVYEPDFKIEEYTLGGKKRQRILLFNKADENLCYYYYKVSNRDLYYCSSCQMKQKYVTAQLLKNANEQIYIELNDAEHVCEPQKKSFLTTIRKPHFKLEECKIDGFKRKFIIIFDQNDKTYCYKYCYYGTDKAYLCMNCRNADALVTARLKKDQDGEQYVTLNKNPHVCQSIRFNPAEFSTIILSSNSFKLETVVENGIETKKLLVYCTTNIVKYFIYSYSTENDIFYCKGCNDKNVSAKLLKNSNGEEYLEMGSKKHIQKCRTFS